MKKQNKFVPGTRIYVNDKMQTGDYILTATYGKKGMDKRLKDALNPQECLRQGVFSGKYMNDCINEFPTEWFENSKHKRSCVKCPPDSSLNKYKVKSRMSLKEWQKRGWLHGMDNRGWFQWYCRYYIGRRDNNVDELQIRRFLSFKRHQAQLNKAEVRANKIGNPTFRPAQRQALLQWAWRQTPPLR